MHTMSKNVKVVIKPRTDSAENWRVNNPILKADEMAVERDTRRLKFGDGVTAWNDLQYSGTVLNMDDIEAGLGLGTASKRNVGSVTGNVVEVGLDNKISADLIPSIPLFEKEVYEVNTKAELDGLTVQKGDMAVVKNDNALAFYNGTKWITIDITVPISVESVNEKTGKVTLKTDDIPEGLTNIYFTSERFATEFGNQSYTDLIDGANLLSVSDTLVLEGGNSIN